MSDRTNQGMRQPQWGGVQSRLHLARPAPLCKGHRVMWRKRAGGPWVCIVCHPPPFAESEIERRTI